MFEQHCPLLKHPNTPVLRQPHWPLLHWPVQHWPAWKHWVPSAWQGFWQVPFLQLPEQHCPLLLQPAPLLVQPLGPQAPPPQCPEQHWKSLTQPWVSPVQPWAAHLPL